MDEKPNYFAIIPANVRYDNELRANEKLLYGEITSLTKKTGECWASNKYFSELYGVKENAVATWIRHLKEREYISVSYEYIGKEIQKRIITIGGIQKDNTYYPKGYEGGIQKGEENNTSINNKENNNINIITKERFKKPTLEEVKKYCEERNNDINAEYFIDYYTKIGWVYGKNRIPIKDWKACVRTWERYPKKESKKDIVPEWMNKDLNKGDELSDEDREFIRQVKGSNY